MGPEQRRMFGRQWWLLSHLIFLLFFPSGSFFSFSLFSFSDCPLEPFLLSPFGDPGELPCLLFSFSLSLLHTSSLFFLLAFFLFKPKSFCFCFSFPLLPLFFPFLVHFPLCFLRPM